MNTPTCIDMTETSITPQEAINLAVEKSAVVYVRFADPDAEWLRQVADHKGTCSGAKGQTKRITTRQERVITIIPPSVCTFRRRPAWFPRFLWQYLLLKRPRIFLWLERLHSRTTKYCHLLFGSKL
jgi:hypothetical protein